MVNQIIQKFGNLKKRIKMKFEVPEHITDKDEIKAWIADQEEQAALREKIKADAAKANDAVAPVEEAVVEAVEEVAVEDEVEVEVKPAPKKKTTRKKKA